MDKTETTIPEEEVKQHIEKMMKDISPCCDAPLDKSRVITSGRYKGHGPRFCSKCKNVVYFV